MSLKDVENRARTVLLAEELKAQGWFRANRAWLIVSACVGVIGYMLGHVW